MAHLKNTRIALIACTKLKNPTPRNPVPAWNLYWASPLFRLSYEYATVAWKADLVYVLSAKYGLIPHTEPVYEYELRLSDLSRVDRGYWALKINDQLEEMGRAGGRQFLFLAGRDYVKPLNTGRLALHGNSVLFPLDGLTQGRRLNFLGVEIARAKSWGRPATP